MAYFKKHSVVATAAAAIIIIVAALAARAASQKKAGETVYNSKPLEQLLDLHNYSQNSHSVSANGTVESQHQVDLKSQSGGKLTRINVKVGDTVRLGQVLAVVDQQGAQAALTSAQGGLAQAQANYNKLLAGASNEQIDAAKIAVANAATALANTKTSQATLIQNAYSTLLSSSLAAVAGSGNTDSVMPNLSGTYNGQSEGSYSVHVYATGSGLQFQASGLETASGDIKNQPVPLGKLGLYLQFGTAPAANDTWIITIPNTYSPAYGPNNNAYQSALKTKDSTIAAAQGQLDSAQAALVQLQAQARPADVQAAQAQILIAQGQVQAAQVAVNNTVITAPFDGTVSAVPVKLADLISAGQKIATLVNQGGLQVKVFVSGDDLPFIKAGAMAQIGDNHATGTVTNLAPSVDPTSKTAEVDIAVTNPQTSGLTVGQNVSITILGQASSTQNNIFILPLQAVKLTPDNKAYVYTLDNNSKAQEVSVTIGTVDGERVEVTSGLTADMKIVSNAYDVSAGDAVQIQN
ncbi:MAG: efflux RND transporter periplasmic adaptor subunit [Candidatus Doudnabacteria bacterium]|nr:efflux RND transporter periplasmic adaptor subunit [Candidatus Doudnabacteria bacterium]